MSIGSELSDRITVPAELSADAVGQFDDCLNAALAEPRDVLVLDCTRMNRVTSDHISLLWRAHRSCEAIGIPVRLESPQPGLVRTLHALDISEFFVIDTGTDTELQPAITTARSPASHSFSHVFAASILGFNSAVARFNGFLQQLHVPETVTSELQTLFYETGFNIVKHGGLDRNSRIAVSCEATHDRLRLRFVDYGIPFDPTLHVTASDVLSAAGQCRAGGLGILMIRRLSDRQSYSRTSDGRNVFEIEKRIMR